MQRDRMLELRVLNGTHAGARVLLPATSQKLGSGPDCDLVLSDPGIHALHAEVEALEDGAVRVQLLGQDTGEVRLTQGQALDLGPVRIAIESADSPWRDDVPVQALPVGAGTADPLAAAAEDGAQDEAGSDTAGRSPHPKARLNPLRIAIAVPVLATIVALVWLLVGTVGRSGEAPATPSRSASAPSAAAPEPSAVEQVNDLLRPLALGNRVRVEPDTRRGARIKAAFLSDAEAATLRAALATLPWSPRLDLLSPDQVQAILEDQLITLAPVVGAERLSVTALGGGRFRIEGRVPTATERDQLMAQLTRASPLVQGFDNQLLTNEEVAGSLLQALRNLGVGTVQGAWNGSRLEGQVTLPQNLVSRWERGLAAAMASHPVAVSIALNLTAPVAPPAPALPFSVRSVVGNETGFVTLDDGQRLAVEGQAKGWRLAAIRSDAVVFERADGARVTLER